MEELKIKKEWSEVVGKDYVIVVAQFAKFTPDTGLGISIEGRVDLDDNHQPIEGCHHHIIELVREDGPVYKHGALKQGDEILEVNGKSMVNLEYNAAMQVINALPHHVRIVAARKIEAVSSPPKSPNSELLRGVLMYSITLLNMYTIETTLMCPMLITCVVYKHRSYKASHMNYIFRPIAINNHYSYHPCFKYLLS